MAIFNCGEELGVEESGLDLKKSIPKMGKVYDSSSKSESNSSSEPFVMPKIELRLSSIVTGASDLVEPLKPLILFSNFAKSLSLAPCALARVLS